ncbi:MAG: phage terminase large subunit, partial [Chloroflexota bacterium]|nr:phage terminase large subunit [Chloroflexota bacterium]
LKRHWWRFWHVPGQPLPPVHVDTPDGPVDCPCVPLPYDVDDDAQSWDMSFKQTDSGSYVVGQVWSRAGANLFLRDQVRARLDFPASIQAVEHLSRQWPNTRAKYVEDAANGPAVISTLTAKIPGLIPVRADTSKAARAHAIAPFVESGNVYLPHPRLAGWVDELIGEAASFPNGAHDDQVDALTQAVTRMLKAAGFGSIGDALAAAMSWQSRSE